MELEEGSTARNRHHEFQDLGAHAKLRVKGRRSSQRFLHLLHFNDNLLKPLRNRPLRANDPFLFDEPRMVHRGFSLRTQAYCFPWRLSRAPDARADAGPQMSSAGGSYSRHFATMKRCYSEDDVRSGRVRFDLVILLAVLSLEGIREAAERLASLLVLRFVGLTEFQQR